MARVTAGASGVPAGVTDPYFCLVGLVLYFNKLNQLAPPWDPGCHLCWLSSVS